MAPTELEWTAYSDTIRVMGSELALPDLAEHMRIRYNFHATDEEYLNHFREWERPTVPWGVLPTVPEDSPPDRVFADQSLRRNNSLSQIYYPTLTADRQPPLIAPPIPASLQELHTLSTPTQLSSKLLSMDVGNNTYLDERSLPLYSCSNDAKLSIESMQQDLKAVSSRRLRTKDTSMEESLDPS